MISSRAVLSLEPRLGRDNLGRSPPALRKVWFTAGNKRLCKAVPNAHSHPGHADEGINSTTTLYNQEAVSRGRRSIHVP
jgi:hypothetical protein